VFFREIDFCEITDSYPVSGLSDCLAEVDICRDLRLEILAIADIWN